MDDILMGIIVNMSIQFAIGEYFKFIPSFALCQGKRNEWYPDGSRRSAAAMWRNIFYRQEGEMWFMGTANLSLYTQ